MAGASVGAARRRRRPRFLAALVCPAALTLGLTAVLAVAGTALALAAPARPLLSTPGAFTLPLVAAALGAAFVGTELGQALIEVRSQAYSFSLSGVPLLLGLLYLPPQVLLPLRIGAAMAVFASSGQRPEVRLQQCRLPARHRPGRRPRPPARGSGRGR